MIPNLFPTRTTNVREVVRDCTSSPHVKFTSYSEMTYLSVGLIGMSNVTLQKLLSVSANMAPNVDIEKKVNFFHPQLPSFGGIMKMYAIYFVTKFTSMWFTQQLREKENENQFLSSHAGWSPFSSKTSVKPCLYTISLRLSLCSSMFNFHLWSGIND